ncbi:MAG: hypothetical protein QM778_36260 [Myxococcales bacterium]
MKLGTKQLGGILSAVALTIGGVTLLAAPGCEDSPLDQGLKACGLDCSQSVAKGQFSVTGISSVDAFFKATVDFKTTADTLAGGIDAELKGLQADFGITPAELTTGGGLAGAIKAKLTASAKASIKVKAEPAKCEVDAHASFEASAQCKAEAHCQVDASCDPGMASFECKGGCEVEASAMVTCEAGATASCTTKGPSVACTGECTGTCTLMGNVNATCGGTCEGTCSGGCEGTQNGGTCQGKCTGMCQGTCKIDSDVGAQCNGSCSGECKVSGPMVSCTADATAKCEGNAMASVMCKGKCEGDFEPPSCMAMADCKASASCDAQAKADASLKVECTPPSLEVDIAFMASADATAKAQGEFYVQSLKARLPKLLAALKKSELIIDAGADLGATASGAFQGALDAFSSGDVSAVAKFKLGTCAPDAFKESATEIQNATADLQAQVTAAGAFSTDLIGG